MFYVDKELVYEFGLVLNIIFIFKKHTNNILLKITCYEIK